MEQPPIRRKPVSPSASPFSLQSSETKRPTIKESNASVSLLSHIESADGETDRNQLKIGHHAPPSQQNNGHHDTPRKRLSRHLSSMTLFGDCASVLLPVGLLGFVVSVWRLDEREYTPGSLDTWQSAITVLATAFPILFAAIVGRLMTATAHWKLGRGAEVGLLEILMGSRTVGSTVLTIFRLRAVSFGTAGLLVLWAASPLGAQAFLRMLSTELRVENEERTITYFDSNSEFYQGMTPGPFESPSFVTSAERLYLALLLSSPTAKTSPMDLWGNIKIPFPDGKDGSDNSDDDDVPSDRWRLRAANSELRDYTSLIGIPVPERFPLGNTTFQLESTYVDLDCSLITIDGDPPEIDLMDTNKDNYPSTNGTWRGPCRNTFDGGPRPDIDPNASLRCNSFWRLALDTFIDQHWSNHTFDTTPASFDGEEGVESGETRLLFYARSPDIIYSRPFGATLEEAIEDYGWDPDEGSFSTACRVRQKYIQSDVQCIQDANANSDTSPLNCLVVKQRESTSPLHPPADISFLSHPYTFEQIASKMPDQGFNLFMWGTDPSLLHLFDVPKRGDSIDMTKVSKQDFGRRLSQLLNTYIGVGQLLTDATIGNFSSNNRNASTTARTEWYIEYIKVSQHWAVLCMLACTTLLCCGILSAIFTHWAQVPEVLGYVSSSIRDSRLVDVPPDVQTLDGLDAARRIWRYRIQWGAVEVDAKASPGTSNERLLGIARQGGIS